MKIISSLLLVALVLSGCYADSGRTTSSDRAGYDLYTNKTINVSVLTPSDWHADVGINGIYTLTSPKQNSAQIYISRSSVVQRMGEGSSPSTTLDEFRAYRLSQITVEEIGPELDSSTQKTSLAGHDAFEVRYSYKPAGDDRKWFVREIYTLAGGNIYSIQYYTRDSSDPELLNIFETMRDSLRILNR